MIPIAGIIKNVIILIIIPITAKGKSPQRIEIREVAPIPINITHAINIVTMGRHTVTPARARSPTPRPTKILSTILYKAFTSKPIIAGIENLVIVLEYFLFPFHLFYSHFTLLNKFQN